MYAEGGIGKTTALLCLNQYYINQACQGGKILPVFIDVKSLDENENKPLLNYVYKSYCGNDCDFLALENLLGDKLSFASEHEIIFLVDGYNEAGYRLKGHIRDEISELKDNNKIRFVVSSRVNEIEMHTLGFSDLILEGLSDDRIKSILGVKEINSSLLEILRIPLFMDKFLKTYNESDYDKINNSGIIRKSHILNSYVKKLMKDTFEKKSERKDVLEFVINKWLPALAFEMVRNKKFIMECDSAEDLFNYKYFMPFFKGSQCEVIKHIMKNEAFEPFSVCCKDFALLGENNGNLSFVHHVWRDFFAARHIINIMNAEKLADLEVDLDENIRRFVGELIKKGDKCECDYETKKDCNSESSPIEDFLQKHNSETKKTLSAKSTANLIEVMKISRNNSVTANFSNLDLTETTFLNCDLPEARFCLSKVSLNCIHSSIKRMNIGKCIMALSNSKNSICAISFCDGVIYYNFETCKYFYIDYGDIIKELDIYIDDIYKNEYNPVPLMLMETEMYPICNDGFFIEFSSIIPDPNVCCGMIVTYENDMFNWKVVPSVIFYSEKIFSTKQKTIPIPPLAWLDNFQKDEYNFIKCGKEITISKDNKTIITFNVDRLGYPVRLFKNDDILICQSLNTFCIVNLKNKIVNTIFYRIEIISAKQRKDKIFLLYSDKTLRVMDLCSRKIEAVTKIEGVLGLVKNPITFLEECLIVDAALFIYVFDYKLSIKQVITTNRLSEIIDNGNILITECPTGINLYGFDIEEKRYVIKKHIDAKLFPNTVEFKNRSKKVSFFSTMGFVTWDYKNNCLFVSDNNTNKEKAMTMGKTNEMHTYGCDECSISDRLAVGKWVQPINILKADFSDSIFIGDEKNKKYFYKVLYTNGANVPDEYIPDLIE